MAYNSYQGPIEPPQGRYGQKLRYLEGSYDPPNAQDIAKIKATGFKQYQPQGQNGGFNVPALMSAIQKPTKPAQQFLGPPQQVNPVSQGTNGLSMSLLQQYGLLGLDPNSEEYKKKMQELMAKMGKTSPYGTDPYSPASPQGGSRVSPVDTARTPYSIQTPLDPNGGMTYEQPGQFPGFDRSKWEY